MSFNFFADEAAFREQTDRQARMAGVTGESSKSRLSRARTSIAETEVSITSTASSRINSSRCR